MIKLFITLLITNILFSCGSKNETGNRPMIQTIEKPIPALENIEEEKKEEIESPELVEDQILNDDDGDGIPNELDASPFISDIPNLDRLITVRINNLEYQLQHEISNKFDLNETIRKNSKRTGNKINYGNGSYFITLPGSLFRSFKEYNLEIENNESSYTMEVSYGNKNRNVFGQLVLSDSSVKQKMQTSLFQGKKVYFKLIKLIDKETGIDLKEAQLLNTYSLSYKEDNRILKKNVSIKKTIKDAFKILKRTDLLEGYNYSRSILSSMIYREVNSSFSIWRLLNTNSQDLNQRPEEGSIVSLIDYKKSDIATKSQTELGFRFNRKTDSFVFNKNNIINFSIEVEGNQSIFYNEEKRGHLVLDVPYIPNQMTPNKCFFMEHMIKEKKIKLNPGTVFDFHLNNIPVTYNYLQNLSFEKVQDLKLSITPNEYFNQSLKTGRSEYIDPVVGDMASCKKYGKAKLTQKDKKISAFIRIHYSQL